MQWEQATTFNYDSVQAWPRGARGSLALSNWLGANIKENLKPTSSTSWTLRWTMGPPLAVWGNWEDLRWVLFGPEATFFVRYTRQDWTPDQKRDTSRTWHEEQIGHFFHDRLPAGEASIRPPANRPTRLVLTTFLLAAAQLCSEDFAAGFDGKPTPADIIWPRWQATVDRCANANPDIRAWLGQCREQNQYEAACCVMEKAITFLWRWAASSTISVHQERNATWHTCGRSSWLGYQAHVRQHIRQSAPCADQIPRSARLHIDQQGRKRRSNVVCPVRGMLVGPLVPGQDVG